MTDTVVRPARTPRRAPADLPFRFGDRALAERVAAGRGEPDWLLADRVAAWQAFEALPVEGNQLYTPYIDLRLAALDDARPYESDGPPGLGDDLRELDMPDGVRLETFAAWAERDPEGFRAALDGSTS